MSAGVGGDFPADDTDSDTPSADDAARRFLLALAQHRHFERETDPPTV